MKSVALSLPQPASARKRKVSDLKLRKGQAFRKYFHNDEIIWGACNAAIISFVYEQESIGPKALHGYRRCFVSRRVMAQRLGLSEADLERRIGRLVTEGALKKSRDGRARILEVVEDRWDQFGYIGDED
jgi:hypothetical protein